MFEQITIIDGTKLNTPAVERLNKISEKQLIHWDSPPGDDKDIIERIGDADAIFLGFNTSLSADVLKKCPNIKYIGLCCTLFNDKYSNVDLQVLKARGIVIKGITHYGDIGMTEFMFSELTAYLQGTKGKQWKKQGRELSGQKIGIIGMGRVGQRVAALAKAYGMEVYYFDQFQIDIPELKEYHYLPLEELLAEVEILSFHLPRHTEILKKEDFQNIKGSILVNLSLGMPFKREGLEDWLKNKDNFAIMDKAGIGKNQDLAEKFDNISYIDKVTGMTEEAYKRLSEKVIDNIEEYISQQKSINKKEIFPSKSI